MTKQKKEGGRWRQSTCHVFGQIHSVNRDRGGKNSNLPRLWTDTLYEKEGGPEKKQRRREERREERTKHPKMERRGTKVRRWRGGTVTCHVFGQIHCVNSKR